MTTTSSTTSSSSILTTLGAGSGIDSAALVSKLVAATYDTKLSKVAASQDANTAKVSSLATLNNGIDAFASALSSLIGGGTLVTQPTSSDASVLTASALPGAKLGGLSAQLSVRQIAQAQSIVSDHVTPASTVIGTGALTLTTASGTFHVTLDSGTDTLASVARALNTLGSGVTASVITDSSGARLALKGATGAANAFTLSVDTGSDASLDFLNYPASGGSGMTLAQVAQDAIVRVDGVDVTRATNTIDDLVDGVSLKLVSAAPTQTITLGASRPTAAIRQAVGDFVSAYNELKSQIDAATASPLGGGDAGPLYNNSGVRQMQQQLARLPSTVLNSAGGPSSLAEIGVSTNRDGTLAVSDATLTSALANNPDGVEAIFNPTQHSSSALIKITSALGATKPGTYQLADIVAGASASGTIAGVAALRVDTRLFASVTSAASGLVIEPQGDLASGSVTVDLGLGGALQAIRDALRANNGVLAAISSQLATEKTRLADEKTSLESQQSAYQDRLTTQFATMDSRVAAFKATQSYLQQQIDIWTKGSNN